MFAIASGSLTYYFRVIFGYLEGKEYICTHD